MEKFDVCVIGAGPAGFAAAVRAVDLGKKVAVIDKNKIGGAGIFNGALSSKTLWELSERYLNIRNNMSGFKVYDSELDFQSIISEMNRAVNDKYTHLKSQLDYFTRNNNVTFFEGKATLQSKHEVEIDLSKSDDVITIKSENIVLAVGSRPRILPDIEVDEQTIMTSDGVGNLRDFPSSMVILGAGVIGCEFATIFSNFAKTKVFLIDKADRILPFEDSDISRAVSKNLEENGVHIHRKSNLIRMENVNGKVEYELESEDGHKEIRTVDKAMISVGRVPNSDNMGLENAGIKLSDRGHCVDDDTRSSVDNIYAVGDFTADIALVNIAELEGRHAIEKMYGLPVPKLKYNNVSTIMFLNPEVASVGINESEARKNGIPYKLAKMKYKYVNRAIAMRKKRGFIKLLVTDDDEMKILGMRVLGEHASSTIVAIALLISKDGSVKELAELVHPHPSIPEGIQECARMLSGNSIIKPEVFNMDLRCYRVTKEGRISNLYEENKIGNETTTS